MSKSRDYQISAKKDLANLFRSGLKRVITQLPTGSGKTFLFIDIANDALKKNKKIIIIIKRRSLIFQTAKSFEGFTGHKPGVVMGSQKLDLKNPVQIVSIDTISRRMNKDEYQFLLNFDMLVCDECFPSNTYVLTSDGSRQIGGLYKMKEEKRPLALSLNHKTGEYEYKKIKNVFKNSKKDRLVAIYGGTSKIECTENHRLLTTIGYKTASEIKVGDALIQNKETSRNSMVLSGLEQSLFVGSFFGDGGVQQTSENVFRLRVRHDKKTQGDYCKEKARLFNVPWKETVNKGYNNNLQIEFSTKTYYIKTDDMFSWCLERLDDIAMSVFWMDDGSVSQENWATRLHTENFSYEQNVSISKKIKELFNIESKVNAYRDYFYLSIPVRSRKSLYDTVKNFIHPSLGYKIHKDFDHFFKVPSKDQRRFCLVVKKKEIIKVDNQHMFDLEVEDNHNYIVAKTRMSNGCGTVVHNCHDSTSKKYSDFLNLFPNKFWLGFTATALPTGNKYLADAGWQDVIVPVTAKELRDRGYLSPEITYAPKKIDVSGIKTVAGDYDQKALAQRAMESTIIGDTVEVYRTHGKNRPALGFGVNIEHSKLCAEAYRQAGIPSVHIDASHDQDERDAAVEKLYTGEIKILWSVGVFSTGTDVPIASCLVYARPTKSEILYVQQVGRVLRPYKKCLACNARLGADPACYRCGSTHFTDIKEDAIIIDQANNCERFGLAYDQRFAKIRAPEKKKKKVILDDEMKTKTCEACYGVYSSEEPKCPYCDHVNAKTKREIDQEEGELERKKSEDLRYARMLVIKNDLMKFSNPKWKESAKWTRLHGIYGDEIFEFRKELEIPGWARAQISRNKKGQRSYTKTQ